MFQSILNGGATSSNSMVIGNPEGNVAIVTLWSKVKEMAKKVESSKYAIMGQLFSAERGLDLLVRNLIANPQITNLVLTGVDFSKSGLVLEDFFRNGFEKGEARLTKKEVWKVKSEWEGYIGVDIPAEVLEELRASLNVTRVADISGFDFSSLQRPGKMREKRVFEKHEEKIKAFAGDYAGYVVRGKTVAEVWLKVLDNIMKFGKVSDTHYDEPQKEVINMLSIIEGEDPHNFHIPEYLPCNHERVKAYIPRITKDLPGGIHRNEYTYGSRMRSWFGTDQVKRAVDKLVKKPVSRAVVISLWDPTKDLEIGGSPCLNHIWPRISEGRLIMTCIFRSHDMFEGYPENAFGLRTLQEEIRAELQQRLGKEIGLGELIILSQSAHLYKDTWEWAQKVTELHLSPFRKHMSRLDPRGNFIVSLDNGEIVLEHTSPSGERVGEFRGKSGAELRDILTRENVISLIPHAIDTGLELMKAEIAAKLGLEYNQDQDLEIKKGSASERVPVKRVIKDGITQTENQMKSYPKILREARIDSMWV